MQSAWRLQLAMVAHNETAPLCGFHPLAVRQQNATGAGVDCACHHGLGVDTGSKAGRSWKERKKEKNLWCGEDRDLDDLRGKEGA
jgi:hypothetical protein